MCLVADYDDYQLELASGERTARKEHTCVECRRTIEAGERYRYWTNKEYGSSTVRTDHLCAHCWGTIELGSALTGCPKFWYTEAMYSLDPDQGFVGNILGHPGLPFADRVRMLRTVAGKKRGWRRRDGSLLPIPAPVPAERTD